MLLPSALHIGHIFLAPPSVICSYLGADMSLINHTSHSSRWEWPLRHHCPYAVPRAVNARPLPSGEGAEKNSLAYRSALTAIGVPPSTATRNRSLIPEISRLE